MRVLFVLDTLARAGTEKSTLQLIKFLKQKHEIGLVYFYPNHSLRQEAELLNMPIFFGDLKGKYDWLNGVKFLRQVTQDFLPDMMVSSLFRANLISRFVAYRYHVPLVGTLVSDSYGKSALKEKKGGLLWKFQFFWWLDKVTAGIPERYIANSQSIADSHTLTLKIPKEKITVVYRGREIVDRDWQGSGLKDGFQFIAVGRLIPVKGFADLIQAFAQVSKLRPGLYLKIFGEGPERPELEKMISTLGFTNRIFLAGDGKELSRELITSDCFVFTSHYEGFSGALIEAMMVGIPIIASDIAMNLEAITTEFSAKTFRVGVIEDLATKMIESIDQKDLMKKMGENAKKVAQERFAADVIGKEYENALLGILNGK